MKKFATFLCLLATVVCSVFATGCLSSGKSSDGPYLVVSDYVKPNTGEDVSDELQELILANPQRVLFFPDGEYLLSKPLDTPANPANSVSLLLSNYAVIKAADNWSGGIEALIRLGAAEPFNNITDNGSNYYLSGGIIDGNNVANGVSIDSGRETRIENVSIKHTRIGLRIKNGANSGSSDADIMNVNIIGTNTSDSIGVLLEGKDNTLTNMRIARVQIGVRLLSGGNCLRNIHPLYGLSNGGAYYKDSIAFQDRYGDNWYDYCYSDQYAIGFYMKDGIRSIYHNCFCFWWKTVETGGGQTGFYADGVFNSLITNAKVRLSDTVPAGEDVTFLRVGRPGGDGAVEHPYFDESVCRDKSYESYLIGNVHRY